ncbi:Xpc, partial [Symbiodinium sp. CCMP2456]
MSAVLQAEEDGPTDVLDRALTLLTEGFPPSSQPRHLKRPKTFKQTKLQGDCPFCGARFQTGAFCTNCGKRLRGGGPTGAADLQKQAAPDAEADDDIVVSAWPEVYDIDASTWIAVDVAFGDLVRHPVVEWPHRGTPMLWICAAGIDANGGFRYRDVTARYSPRWWEVELARGSRSLQEWFADMLKCMSDTGPLWPAV